jgi:hypothetical protein
MTRVLSVIYLCHEKERRAESRVLADALSDALSDSRDSAGSDSLHCALAVTLYDYDDDEICCEIELGVLAGAGACQTRSREGKTTAQQAYEMRHRV